MSTDENKRFLSTVFAGTVGLIELLALDKDAEGVASQIFTNDIGEICQEVERLRDVANLYFGVTTKKDKSGNKDSSFEIVGFYADIDFRDFKGGEAEAREILLKFQFKPSIIVGTGGGLHCYWLFREPVVIEDNLSWFEGVNRGIAERLGADSCWDASRRLRIPGTTNFPTKRKRAEGRSQPSPCLIEEMNDLRYNPDDFEDYYREIKVIEHRAITTNIDFENIRGRLEKDLSEHQTLKSTWEGHRPDLKDQSRSGYDMALANLLAILNYAPEEIKTIISHNPQGKGSDATDSYLDLTINKALTAREDAEQKIITSANDDGLSHYIVPFGEVILPPTLEKYLLAAGKTTASPNEFIVTAALVALSGAIGTRSFIHVGARKYFPTIWCINVALSSVQYKSTGNDLAKQLLQWREAELEEEFNLKMEQYKLEMREYEALKKNDRVNRTEPVPPVRVEIIYADDETLESKYQTLHDSPDGGVTFYDEIAGFVLSFDRYTGQGGVEVSKQLSIFDNRAFKYKRKKDKTLLSVARPFCSIIGATTIEGLASFYTRANDLNGFFPRFIFNFCPPQVKPDDTFLKPDIDNQLMCEVINRIKAVMKIKGVRFTLSPEALEMFECWYKEHNSITRSPTTPEWVRSYWKRLESYCLKFAHIYHVFETDSPERNLVVGVDRMAEAISFANYFRGQALKLGLHFRGTTSVPASGISLILKVAKVIKQKGVLKPRDIQRSIHGSPPAEEIEAALNLLKKEGFC